MNAGLGTSVRIPADADELTVARIREEAITKWFDQVRKQKLRPVREPDVQIYESPATDGGTPPKMIAIRSWNVNGPVEKAPVSGYWVTYYDRKTKESITARGDNLAETVWSLRDQILASLPTPDDLGIYVRGVDHLLASVRVPGKQYQSFTLTASMIAEVLD